MRNSVLTLALGLIAGRLAGQAPTTIPQAPVAPTPAEVPTPTIEQPAPAASTSSQAKPASSPKDTGYAAILNRPAPTRKVGEVDELPVLEDVPVWYFPKGKLNHHAVVTFQAFIDSTGRVEPDSLKITKLSDTTFAVAARFTLLGARYRPASWHGAPVRTWVIQTVRYRGDRGRRCEMDAVTPLLPTDCGPK